MSIQAGSFPALALPIVLLAPVVGSGPSPGIAPFDPAPDPVHPVAAVPVPVSSLATPSAVTPRRPAAPDRPEPAYAVRVTNRSLRAVTVYVLLGGPPLRLGRVHPGRVARLPANCSDFLSRDTDFELRSVGGRYRLEGASIGDCGQTIEIEVLPIGLEFSRIRVIRDAPPPGGGG